MAWKPPAFIVTDDVGVTWEFETAREVSLFLWGKNIKKYHVYVKTPIESAEVDEIRKQLEGGDKP